MSAQDLLTELLRLPAADRDLIVKALHDLKEKAETDRPPAFKEARTPNLHPGAMTMAPDFDDPLSDEFWFGKEA